MFMPLKKVKGTTEQRLQQARELNVEFYKNLQKNFVDNKVSPAKFKASISKTIGRALSINMANPAESALPIFSHGAGKYNKATVDTYVFSIPRVSYFDDSIKKKPCL